jgi:hypothetical protein
MFICYVPCRCRRLIARTYPDLLNSLTLFYFLTVFTLTFYQPRNLQPDCAPPLPLVPLSCTYRVAIDNPDKPHQSGADVRASRNSTESQLRGDGALITEDPTTPSPTNLTVSYSFDVVVDAPLLLRPTSQYQTLSRSLTVHGETVTTTGYIHFRVMC